jgi:hypothetical protein
VSADLVTNKSLSDAFRRAIEAIVDPVTGRKGPWMSTFTGRAFFSFDPIVSEIDILDIAHQLSGQVRWRGASRTAQRTCAHALGGSFVVEALTGSAMKAFAFLHHDDDEAYLVDWASPVKAAFPFFRDVETRLSRVIYDANGIPLQFLDDPTMSEIDKRLAQDEYVGQMLPPPLPVYKTRRAIGVGPLDSEDWERRVLERAFIDRHFDLSIRLGLATENDRENTLERLQGIYDRIENPTAADTLLMEANGVLPALPGPEQRAAARAVADFRRFMEDAMERALDSENASSPALSPA